MTGLGDVAYTGPADPDESTITCDEYLLHMIHIGASDVVLDGLTIASTKEDPTSIYEYASVYGIKIKKPSWSTSEIANIKVTNCVIRHLANPHTARRILVTRSLTTNPYIKYNELHLIEIEGKVRDIQIIQNELRDVITYFDYNLYKATSVYGGKAFGIHLHGTSSNQGSNIYLNNNGINNLEA